MHCSIKFTCTSPYATCTCRSIAALKFTCIIVYVLVQSCRGIAALNCPVCVQHVEYSFWNQLTRNNFAKTLPEGKASTQN